jgi:hypothetical protein
VDAIFLLALSALVIKLKPSRSGLMLLFGKRSGKNKK